MVLADHGAVIPSRREAFRYWLRLGLISFGGPVAQVAIMHRELVEERRWVDERTYLNALNLVILLPGPEALQLAIWLGWRLHGVMGGVVAGLCFLVPSVFLLLALSFLYALHGDVPLVAAAILGLKATAIALIVQAVVRISGRALRKPLHWLLAGVAFVLMVGKFAPFPLVVAGAAVVGLLLKHQEASPPPPANRGAVTFPWRTLATGFVLWVIPAIAILQLAGPDSVFAEIYRFFTTAALVTFGGAYAILAWVNQQAVRRLRLAHAGRRGRRPCARRDDARTAHHRAAVRRVHGGLEPAGRAAPGVSATIASMLASWATFLPSFVFILVGAPYGEKLASNVRLVGGARLHDGRRGGRDRQSRDRLRPQHPVSRRARGARLERDRQSQPRRFALLQWTRVDAIWVIIGGAAAGLALGFV